MLAGLLYFLVGCLILVVVIYVARLVIDMLGLPEPVKQIALIIIGLVCLIIILGLVFHVIGHPGLEY